MAFNPAIFSQLFEQAFDREFTPAFVAYGGSGVGPASNWKTGHAFGQAFGGAFGRAFSQAFAAASGAPVNGLVRSSGAPAPPGSDTGLSMADRRFWDPQPNQSDLYPDGSVDPYAAERILRRQERFKDGSASPDLGDAALDQPLPTSREAEPEDWWSLESTMHRQALDDELDAMVQERQQARLQTQPQAGAVQPTQLAHYDQVIKELKQIKLTE